MNLDHNKLALVFLSIVVIASGCTDGGGEETESTSPIKINQFSIFPNPAPANQTVTMEVEVENTGDVDAEDVHYRIFNPPFATDSEDTRAWRNENGKAMANSSNRTFDVTDTLRAPTESNPSIPRTSTVSMTSPDLEQGKSISYDFFARLFYNYSTRAKADIQVMDSERYREKGIQRSQPELENTQGPIQLDVRTSTPLVVYEDNKNENPSTEMCVIVRNEGDGQPYWGHKGNPPDKYTENAVQLEVQDVGNINFSSTDDSSENSVTADLVGNRAVECFDMTVDSTGQTNIQQTVTLELEAEYGYQEETQTSVTVEGRR